ncbi:antibiotic biosynthesis monooxygenase family protein [Frigidibacter sp. ROC022]|uniref:antibiotic biosynthesis monooxygenase family protein n=1 Tax=Frigidibacter sp. ROC022 TaxID=2971796 RepID=UPI00215B0BE2|nr:antibiotic biosynthesis monooxygenase family protein [Frigidibacter sp. ROC022]MCR8725553.1 antibiotic biosynthesis monooxygenase [Frigidibacter sp. ROC022]
MIIEMVTIRIKPDTAAAFEAGVSKARAVFRRAPGCLGMELGACIEEPGLYQLLIRWETLEAHMEGFRKSPLLQEWRDLVQDCFAVPPSALHYAIPMDAELF